MNGWIAVDFDGTLVTYDGWQGPDHIGQPIWPMINRVRKWLAEGKEVRIFTARVYWPDGDEDRFKEAERSRKLIQDWSQNMFDRKLVVTNVKDFGMIELWDDRCVQVIKNTGIAVEAQLDPVEVRLILHKLLRQFGGDLKQINKGLDEHFQKVRNMEQLLTVEQRHSLGIFWPVDNPLKCNG